jgi:hypothetical protein
MSDVTIIKLRGTLFLSLGMFILTEIIVSAIVTVIATIIIHLHSSWQKNKQVPGYLWSVTCRRARKFSDDTADRITEHVKFHFLMSVNVDDNYFDRYKSLGRKRSVKTSLAENCR